LTGVLYALLPSTVIYSFLPRGTIVVALGCTIIIWATTYAATHPVFASLVTGTGLLILYLTRPTFSWVFAALWIMLLLVLIFRRHSEIGKRIGALLTVGAFVLLIAVVQIHYARTFGLVTTSSWAGQNLAKALSLSGWMEVPEGTLEAIEKQGLCDYSLVTSLLRDGQPNDVWDLEKSRQLPGCNELLRDQSSDVLAIGLASKAAQGSESVNLNSLPHLELSRAWLRIMMQVLEDNPLQILSMATSSGSGPSGSGFALYLSPPQSYFGVSQQSAAIPAPIHILGGLIALVLSPGALLIGTAAIFSIFLQRPRRFSTPQVVLIASWTLILYHLAVSVLLEYGENMRYQVEVLPVLVLMGCIGVKQLAESSTSLTREPKV